jgi:acyl carrier protein
LEHDAEALKVDTFLLSCRALGRNVEDNMLLKLAELAHARGIREVHLTLNPTSKNRPATDFLERVFPNARLAQDGGFVYVVRTDSILNHPQLVATSYGWCFVADRSLNPEASTTTTTGVESSTAEAQSELAQRIASLNEARQIVTAIRGRGRMRQSRADDVAVAPRTPTEERMAKIWLEVLNLDHIGVHDDFFALGGHSLLATQLLSRIHDEFNVRPPLAAVFQTPTIAGLAETIAQEQIAQVDPENLAALLAQLSQISEEDAARMVQ